MAGMFGNRFDVQSGLDYGRTKEALDVGRLSSYGVGQMAAYQDGLMGSPFAAALSDQMNPQMVKQNLLDELQRKHPNPDTPEKLTALASDLFANGFGDMGIKVQEAASQLLTANASMVKANAPTADLYKNLAGAMSNNVKNTGFVNAYIGKYDPILAVPFKKGDGYETYGAYKDARQSYIDDIDTMFSSWAQSQKYNGASKGSLATLMNDDAGMKASFMQYLGIHGDTDKAETMLTLMNTPDVENPPPNMNDVGNAYLNKDGDRVVIDYQDVGVINMQKEVDAITAPQAIINQITYIENAKPEQITDSTRIKLELLKKRLKDLTDDASNNTGNQVAMNDAMGMDVNDSPENAFVFA